MSRSDFKNDIEYMIFLLEKIIKYQDGLMLDMSHEDKYGRVEKVNGN